MASDGSARGATAERPSPDSGSDEPAAKRLRAGLTEKQQDRLSVEQVDLLAKSYDEVVEFSEAEVQQWVAAALRAVGREGSIAEEGSQIGKVVTVLKKQEVCGAALVNLTREKLLDGPFKLVGGPAEVLATRIAGLQAHPSPDLEAGRAAVPAVTPADSVAGGAQVALDKFDGLYRGKLRPVLARKCCQDRYFAETVGREDAERQLQQYVQKRRTSDLRRDHCIVAISAMPGVGKSHFADDCADRVFGDAVRALDKSAAVHPVVLSGNGSPAGVQVSVIAQAPIPLLSWTIIGRCFGVLDDDGQDAFYATVRGLRGWEFLTIREAVSFCARTLRLADNCFLVIIFDEWLRLIDAIEEARQHHSEQDRRKFVRQLMTGINEALTRQGPRGVSIQNFWLITSLRESEQDRALSESGKLPVWIRLSLLKLSDAVRLAVSVGALKGPVDAFSRAVDLLAFCGGHARALECVCKKMKMAAGDEGFLAAETWIEEISGRLAREASQTIIDNADFACRALCFAVCGEVVSTSSVDAELAGFVAQGMGTAMPNAPGSASLLLVMPPFLLVHIAGFLQRGGSKYARLGLFVGQVFRSVFSRDQKSFEVMLAKQEAARRIAMGFVHGDSKMALCEFFLGCKGDAELVWRTFKFSPADFWAPERLTLAYDGLKETVAVALPEDPSNPDFDVASSISQGPRKALALQQMRFGLASRPVELVESLVKKRSCEDDIVVSWTFPAADGAEEWGGTPGVCMDLEAVVRFLGGTTWPLEALLSWKLRLWGPAPHDDKENVRRALAKLRPLES